ncbi:hypothetical protein, partial [Cognatitamlana onchidii]|uniref:hypothetical protein n=1 Tax=Cognatitamlana onchidii TaxID=2562860 RepID=UPI00196B5CF3
GCKYTTFYSLATNFFMPFFYVFLVQTLTLLFQDSYNTTFLKTKPMNSIIYQITNTRTTALNTSTSLKYYFSNT